MIKNCNKQRIGFLRNVHSGAFILKGCVIKAYNNEITLNKNDLVPLQFHEKKYTYKAFELQLSAMHD